MAFLRLYPFPSQQNNPKNQFAHKHSADNIRKIVNTNKDRGGHNGERKKEENRVATRDIIPQYTVQQPRAGYVKRWAGIPQRGDLVVTADQFIQETALSEHKRINTQINPDRKDCPNYIADAHERKDGPAETQIGCRIAYPQFPIEATHQNNRKKPDKKVGQNKDRHIGDKGIKRGSDERAEIRSPLSCKVADRIIKQAVDKENSQGRENLEKTESDFHDLAFCLTLFSLSFLS